MVLIFCPTFCAESSKYKNKLEGYLKFDVRYGSTSFFDGLTDKAIYDKFDLIADLEF